MAKQTYEELVFTADASKAIAAVSRLEVKIKKLTAAYEDSDKRTKESRAIRDELAASVDKLNLATSRSTGSIEQNTFAHENSTLAIQSKINALVKEMRTMDISTKAYKQKVLQVNKLSASMHQGRKATGLATTSAMEFGRVVSDAPYGIRGMANNVSQLTSLLFQGSLALDEATGKTIGFTGAIKGMWKAMMGPLGIMIAIQLIIAAIDYFAGSTKKAGKELSKFTDQMVETISKTEILSAELQTYLSVILNSSKNTVEYANALAKLKKLGLDPATMSTEQLALAVQRLDDEQLQLGILKNKSKVYKEDADAYITLLLDTELKEADIRIRMADNEKKLKESGVDESGLQLKKELEDNLAKNKEYNEKKTKALEDYKANELRILKVGTVEEKRELGRLEVLEGELDALEEQQLQISQTSKQYAEYGDLVIAKQKEIDDFINKQEKGKDPKKPKKAFSLIDFDDTKTVSKFLKEQELLLAKSNVEKLDINQRYRVEDLKAVFDNEKKKDQIKLDTYLNSEASDEQKQKAKDLFNQKQIDSETKHEDALIELNLAGAYKRGQLNIKIEEDFRGTMHQNQLERTQAHLATMSNLLSDNSVESLEFLHEAQREVWAVEDEIFKQSLEKKREKLTAQGFDFAQIQIEIDEDKFAREQEVADREVQLEIDKINRKKEVNEEYVSYISGLGDVFAAFGKKNEFLAIAGLALQKGAEIASVVIKTTAANSEISAAAAKDYSAAVTAGNSSVSQGFALMGNPITASIGSAMVSAGGIAVSSAKAIPAAATLAKNKNRIKAGMSIAKIAATTLTSGALGGGSGDSGGDAGTGGGGGGSTSFAPSFNVVGNSNENQLAEGIGGQVNMPTRAYVVYDDIQQAGSVVEESIENSGI